jgi:FkbM family methyltransferase
MNIRTRFRQWGHAFKRLPPIRFIRGLFFTGSTVKRAEPDVWSFIGAQVKTGWRCVDVGANRGEFSFLMAQHAGACGAVYAFELHPDNLQLLRSNLWRYRRRVTTENLAVSDGTSDRVEVFAGRHGSGAEWNIVGSVADSSAHRPEFSVKATSLDRYFPPSEKIDLVKIDVEGTADKVLAGMARILRKSCPVIVIEVHNDAEWEGLRGLEAAGYALCDVTGKNLAGAERFVFHSIAVPKEQRMQFFFLP